MIPIRDLFESHLTVANLSRSMKFYGESLGLELAEVFWERHVAFYWIGARGNSMLGLWETGDGPQKLNLHLAFKVDLPELLQAPERLKAAGVTPLDFWGNSTQEPWILAWMPAATLYFRDPDGHMLEFLSMLPETPQKDLGIIPWSQWQEHLQSKHSASTKT
ncbi:MAG TPA: VOC family protein [Candidatus Angelobacter sp.]|nr:VOC family protein [Candidatus Angelobacter sp.]